MWKAAFSGQSEKGGGSSVAGKSSKDESRRRKSHRADSTVSSGSRRDDGKGRDRRRSERVSNSYDNGSRPDDDYSYTSGPSAYATAPISQVGEPRPLTESAVRMVPSDDEEWEDDEKDTRGERKSSKRNGHEKRPKSRRSENYRSRSRSLERTGKGDKLGGRAVDSATRSGDRIRDRKKQDTALVSESSRAIPEMGSFAQFPGQFDGGIVGPPSQEPAIMSGALPSSAPQSQFTSQDPYARPQIPSSGPSRSDSYGAAADYYLDTGESVQFQPGARPHTPSMLVNPNHHLTIASSEPHPVQDTGNGSAADFYGGKVSSTSTTPAKRPKPGKHSSSGSNNPKPSRTSSLGAAAAATAAPGAVAMASSAYHSSSASYQEGIGVPPSSRPMSRPNRHNSEGSSYYARPTSSTGTYPPTLPSTNGFGPPEASNIGVPGNQSTNSNVPLYAAGAAAAGLAAYEYKQHQSHSSYQDSSYSMTAGGGYGQGPPQPPRPVTGGYSYYSSNAPGSSADMQQHSHHTHKGAMTRLKDGIFNLISTPEDTAKMEMYTEYIGVCKHCFDPRTSAWDAPRVHHYHRRRDSFEDLRRRRSRERLGRKGSNDSLRRTGSARVNKDSRYYTTETRKHRESGDGMGILGTGLAAAGVAAGANAMLSGKRKDFDDTYSVKSGHRESSAVRRRSRSSSRERRQRSSYGVVRPDRDEFITVSRKDGTLERRRVAGKSRSRSRDRKSNYKGAATGAALGAAALAASSRRSRSPSPTVLNGSFGAPGTRSRRADRRSPTGSSYYDNAQQDRPTGSGGIFGGFFSPSQRKRRTSREHQKKRKGFFTFSNSSASSSGSDMAFGDGSAGRSNIPLRRKSSTTSTRGRRASRKKSDDHLAATVAGIGATAAALAVAQRGGRISKRTSRPELGKRRDVRYQTSGHDSSDEEWEDELPSDVDDNSSVDGGLAFGDYDGKRLSNRNSMESVGSQSSAAGLGAWGWRWGGKDKKRSSRRPSLSRPEYQQSTPGSFTGPSLAGLAAGAAAGTALDPSRPVRSDNLVYVDDTGRRLPSMDAVSTGSSPHGPMQFVDPAPISDAGSIAGSRHTSVPGASGPEPPVIRPGPGPIQQPRPINPVQPGFTQAHSAIDDFALPRPDQPRRTQSSPTQSSFAKDAALIGGAALATGGIIAGMSGKRGKEPSNVRFGFTDEQMRKESREDKKEAEERRRADRTRALKEEAERAAKESRQEEVRSAREQENRRAAEAELERRRDKERARDERQRSERQVRDRQETANAESGRRSDPQGPTRREAEQDSPVAQSSERSRPEHDGDVRQQSFGMEPIAAGAAAAATVGAVIAGREHNKNRGRTTRDNSYYDEAHSIRPSTEAGSAWDKGYIAAEIKPTYEHSGEPITDDDVFDPNYFKRQHSPAENARYAEFARRAADKIVSADKVVEDRGRAYEDKTTYADFFAPKELLGKAAEGKARAFSPVGDNDVQIWHARDAEVQSHLPYGFADPSSRSRHAPYSVPKLNVIAPTPPIGSRSATPDPKAFNYNSPTSPLAQSGGADDDPTKSIVSGKPERSRSISWGEDKTHIYDADTPDSHHDRDSYVTSPDLRSDHIAADAFSAAAAATAGAAMHDIVVEDPSGQTHRFREREWARDEEDGFVHRNSQGNVVDDADDVEDITPEPESSGFYRQPFFESVSDLDNAIFGLESPGHEGVPPVRGFVEGETDEPTPAAEKPPHIPGGFDEDVYDTGRSNGQIDDATAAEQAQPEPGAPREPGFGEETTWEPPLSKKEKKKREKAGKQAGDLAGSDPATPVSDSDKANVFESVTAPHAQPEPDEFFMSKKDKKKRDKAKKQGFADVASSVMTEPSALPEHVDATPTRLAEPEPPVSKKEQKKRDKEAKKQGFADVADTILAAGGIAAAAAALDSTEDPGSAPSKKQKKGKKAGLGETSDRDPRDYETPATAAVEVPASEPSGMPGAWDSEQSSRRGSKEGEVEEVVDPFQYQIHDEETSTPVPNESATAREANPEDEWSQPSKKSKKKSKRRSSAFNVPEVSSPLRSEVPFDDYIGARDPEENGRSANDTRRVNGHEYNNDDIDKNGTIYAEPTSFVEDRSATGVSFNERPTSDSRSPDDSRSVASAPAPEIGSRRTSRRDVSRRSSDYFDEPSYAYETQSVAASEPADVYEGSRKSKRRSKHAEDDDSASVKSSRSKREKEESPSSAKREKKASLFGLFSRKSVDDYKSAKDENGVSLSRKSSHDSKANDDEEGRRRRSKKSGASEYGDDDGSRERRRRSSRHDSNGRTSPARSEPVESSYRKPEDEDNGLSRLDSRESRNAVSESGHRHHHRRDTDPDAYESNDQSFLDMRVEDLPPLPDSRPTNTDSAAVEQKQGVGSPAEDESVAAQEQGDDVVEQSRKVGVPPTALNALEASSPSVTSQRPVSSTAVPLRFPFGHPPQTPQSMRERAHSFSSSVPMTPSPMTPASGKRTRQGRPHSTEIKPLYLVERNRKTPEVEDILPSLPSSKPSSRASSVHNSDDNYQSAVEEMKPNSPGHKRALTIDTTGAEAYQAEEYLDSQQTTPKAMTFDEPATERPSRQEPQFYTWEDFARDERLHDETEPLPETSGSVAVPQAPVTHEGAEHHEHGAESSRGRSKSPLKNTSGFKSAAAAAMLGTAAVYAHHKLHDRSPERSPGLEAQHHGWHMQQTPSMVSHGYPLPAPVEEPNAPQRRASNAVQDRGHQDEPTSPTASLRDTLLGESDVQGLADDGEPLARASFSRSASPKEEDIHAETLRLQRAQPHMEPLADNKSLRQDSQTGRYAITSRESEAQAEEGAAINPPPDVKEFHLGEEYPDLPQHDNDYDRYPFNDQALEPGTVLASSAAHTMPVYDPIEASSGTTSGVQTPFMAFPTPADERSDRFWQAEEQLEDGDAGSRDEPERPSTSYKVPTAKGQPAPLVVEQRTAAGNEEWSERFTAAPQLTRKQSKKAKKKQKAAKLFEEELPETPETNSPTNEMQQEEGVELNTEIFDDDRDGTDGGDYADSERERSATLQGAPTKDFGVNNFGRIAHSAPSHWQDSQAQAFQNAMRKNATASQDLQHTPGTDMVSPIQPVEQQTERHRDEPPESTDAKRMSKKDKKKKKRSMWSDFDTEPEMSRQAEEGEEGPQSDRDATQADEGEADVTAGATPVTTAAATTAVEVSSDAKSKKKAKKDKKKKQQTGFLAAEAEEMPMRNEGELETPIFEQTLVTEGPRLSTDSPEDDAATHRQEAVIEPEAKLDYASESREPVPSEEPFFSSISRKQSKKDKKRAKAQAWADTEPSSKTAKQAEQFEGPVPRQLSTHDSAFVDADEVQPDAADSVPPTEREETIQGPSLASQEEFVGFAPIGKKKNKKDKKKQKFFDWNEPKPESPAEPSDAPRELEPPAPDETRAIRTEEPIAEERAALDKGPNVEPEAAEQSSPVEETTVQYQPVNEEASGTGKKSRKDKKKRQILDWTDPGSEIATSTPAGDRYGFDGVQMGDVQAQEDPARAVDTDATNEDDTSRPGLSRKQSKKDKKKRMQQSLWEPEADAEFSNRRESFRDLANVEGNATKEVVPLQITAPVVTQVDNGREDLSRPEETPVTNEADEDLSNPQEARDVPELDDSEYKKAGVAVEDDGQTGSVEDTRTGLVAPWQSSEDSKLAVVQAPPQEESVWTTDTKKKGKKGKNGRKSAPETPPVLTEAESAEQPSVGADESRAATEPWTAPEADEPTEERAGQCAHDTIPNEGNFEPDTEKSGFRDPPTKDFGIEELGPREDTEPNLEEGFAWMPTTKKKGRKGKKGRQFASESPPSQQEPRAEATSVSEADQPSTTEKSYRSTAETSAPNRHHVSEEAQQDQLGSGQDSTFETVDKPPGAWIDDQGQDIIAGDSNVQNNESMPADKPASPGHEDQDDPPWTTMLPENAVAERAVNSQARGLGSTDPEAAGEARAVASDGMQEDPWSTFASSNKGRKGKKGKRSASETPVTIESEHVETVEQEPHATTFDDAVSTPQVEAASTDLDRADGGTDSFWAVLSSKKKKGKKGKKSESGTITPAEETIKEESQTPLDANTAEESKEDGKAQDEALEASADPPLRSNVTHDDGILAAEATTAERPEQSNFEVDRSEDLVNEPGADPTFADVWAEEDLASHQDHDTVRDLMDEPTANASDSFWTPSSSKKAKRGKKGKKGETGGTVEVMGTAEANSASTFALVETAGEAEFPKQDNPVDNGTEAQEVARAPVESQYDDVEYLETGAAASSAEGQEKQRNTAGDEFGTPDESSNQPKILDRAAGESPQTPAYAWEEKTVEAPADLREIVEAPQIDDPWEAPVSKRKGKKGKKSRQSSTFDVFGAEEMPVPTEESAPTPAAAESESTPVPASGESQEPTEAEASDVWSMPTAKGKKGKKGKKARQVFSWADEPVSVSAEHEDGAKDGEERDTKQQLDSERTQGTRSRDSLDMRTGGIMAMPEDAPTAVEPQRSPLNTDNLGSTSDARPGKKDKKKAKKSRANTVNPWTDAFDNTATTAESATLAEHEASRDVEGAAASDTMVTNPAAHDIKHEAEKDEWAGSSPPKSEEDNQDDIASSMLHRDKQEPGLPAEARATDSVVPTDQSQDIDFAATVAAGLADSGFDPNLVVNDPVYHRRASPPGILAEADPDEGFALTTTKRRKGKRGAQGRGASESPTEEPHLPSAEAPSDNMAGDDFENTIGRGLSGSGFDPALLEQALSSSNDQSVKEDNDAEDFSFATSRRNKKKKKNSQRSDGVEVENVVASAEGEAPTKALEQSRDVRAAVADSPTTEDHQPTDPNTISEHVAKDFAPDPAQVGEPDAQMAAAVGDDLPSQGAVDILTVGRDELDMDEMDRQYRAYKKAKRKQKKLNAATKAAGLSGNTESALEDTERSALTSEAEGLSRNTTRSDEHSGQHAPGQAVVPGRPDATAAEFESATSPTTPKGSVIQGATPDVEVERRRALPAGALIRDRQQRPEFQSSDPRPPQDGSEARSVAAGVAAAALGSAAASMAKSGSSTTLRHEPSWSFEGIDTQQPPTSASPTEGKDSAPIRDSGYQEGRNSPDRSTRTSREVPDIVHTRGSSDSLRQRRSLEPLRLPLGTDDSWAIKNPKRRSDGDRGRNMEASSRTPSAETPLKPTSKERASYLFTSPPGDLAELARNVPRSRDASAPTQNFGSPADLETHPVSREPGDHKRSREEDHREHSTASPRSGPLSPTSALHSIPEEVHGKRLKPKSDVGGPEQIKVVKRTETPQHIRAQERALVPAADRLHMTLPAESARSHRSGSSRSASNPLSTDELIHRLSWPAVDENNESVHMDRQVGHRLSRPMLPDPRSPSVMSNRSNNSGQHFRSPQDLRSYSRTSNRSSTPSLRRTSLSGDLRAASRRGDSGSAAAASASPKTIPFEPPPTPPLNDDEVIAGSASRAFDMNDDVFVGALHWDAQDRANQSQQGYGDAEQARVSPTRPPSVRKRQSMHMSELQSKIDQLEDRNRALEEARLYAEQTSDVARGVDGGDVQQALQARDFQLQEKDSEIERIKMMLEPLQEEVARLSEINAGLTEANKNLVDDTNGRYATLQAEHAQAHEHWQSTSRDLETMRQEHGRITSGMKDIIETEVASALADKNAEILRLREQLDIAAEQVRALQVQIQSSKTSDWLSQRDEDYFDGSCQKLCQHVQQWVLRFSKLSDNRVCRLSTDLNDDKIEARLDNAILDGSDVDKLLGDRVRRRDVFMSVVMTMVWEYVFTRYLFGMDREQRQKLKALEKLLSEVGPPRAVAHWRATTLTLLSKRPSFETQCTLDTEAVAHEVFGVLSTLLPPPSSSEQQLLLSLQKVIGIAVNLSIEMRTQRAEYIMLPPLQPEYDTNGDLVRKVHFNSSLMNERSGYFSSNEELAAASAVVKIVLFPLVVKKGDDVGEGEEEIVVCPAQVLVQNDGGRGKKVVRVMSQHMEIDDPIRNRQSRHSLVSETPGSVGF